MLVGIDNTPLISPHKVRGVGFYTQRLIESLEKLAIKDGEFSLRVGNSKKLLAQVDLIHYPFFDPFFLTLPIFKKKPTIVTVHDLIPLRFPKHFPSGVRGSLKWQIQKVSLKGARVVITDSFISKRDIIHFTGFKKDRIFVIHLAADEIFKPIKDKKWLSELRRRYKLPEKFVLYVGDFNWNKNVNLLAKTCLKLDYPLIVVSRQALDGVQDQSHPENQSLVKFQKLARDNPEKIIRLGFVPTKDLVGIYNLATLYVQPSFAEGFGLPVLEAMACGCPVVTSERTSLAEIAGEAALLINPSDRDSLIKAVKACWLDVTTRRKLSNLGLSQAAKFSWGKTAEATVNVYKEIYEKKI